jgi:hypothetical protein
VTPVAAFAIASRKLRRASAVEFPSFIIASPHGTDAGSWSAECGRK